MKKLCLFLVCLSVLLAGCGDKSSSDGNVVTLRIGHVGHDHHLALYVACDHWQAFADTGLSLKTVQDRQRYDLYQTEVLLAHLEIVRVGGGSLMPTALAQQVIDVGFGGVAAVIAAADSGSPVRLISPLHSRGDMFVVSPDSPIETWDDFVAVASASPAPLRIGYKDPSAVAKLILEEALTHEGIAFSRDVTRTDVAVHLINVKGGGKLNVSLGSGLVDGYVGNNPFCAIAVEENIGRIVCALEDLPPGTFRNHPCCCIAANTTAIAKKADAIVAVLTLCQHATELINRDLDKAVETAVRWLGTSRTVEAMSIPTSGYCMEFDPDWQASMNHWYDAMARLGHFNGTLKGLSPTDACEMVYEMTLLQKMDRNRAQNR